MKQLLKLVAATALSVGGFAAGLGEFQGRVIVEWLDDPFVPTMRLVEPFSFRQPDGKRWTVSGGYVMKGTGFPPLFRDHFGQPFNGGFRKSSIVYDYVAQEMADPWDDAQRMFLDASVAEGVTEAGAKAMYTLLRAQGLTCFRTDGSHRRINISVFAIQWAHSCARY